MNLVVNACHATGGQGEVEIDVRASRLAAARPAFPQDVAAGEYAVLSVRDEGTGIDREILNRVFEPFFTTKASGKGTGLGLALVYQIVKAHEGSITIETEAGTGTTVSVFLPVATELALPVAARAAPERVQGQGESILLVDDDRLVLDTNKRLFHSFGYRVSAHESPVAALETFAENPQDFDLVFSDLSMPRMDGARLSSKIRELRADVPIILVTGFPDALDAGDLRDLTVLQKPANASEISQAVGAALTAARQRAPRA